MNQQRYSRQLLMPEFGETGQLKLLSSSILVVGAGGLGSPVLYYLAAAGVGTIGIVEDDSVSLSNLHRQILFTTDEVGKSKGETAKKRLQALNPEITIQLFSERLSSKNALGIIQNFDVVVDASDNFPTRYLVNDACVLLNKPFVFGAVHRFEGQVAVFNHNGTITYRDVFPEPPPPEMAPNCAEAGVLGVMAGIIGSYQALEAIKLITEIGEGLVNKLLLIDALSGQSRTIKINKNESLPQITQLIDYESFCGIKPVNEITISELKKWQNDGKNIQLIDVREESEFNNYNIGAENFPLSRLTDFIPQISREKTVVIHCQSGNRSQQAIQLLEKDYGFTNILNLKDGLVNA